MKEFFLLLACFLFAYSGYLFACSELYKLDFPLNKLKEIAHKFGIVIIYVNQETLNKLGSNLNSSSNIRGLYCKYHQDPFVKTHDDKEFKNVSYIYLRDDLKKLNAAFTLAHELGHYFLIKYNNVNHSEQEADDIGNILMFYYCFLKFDIFKYLTPFFDLKEYKRLIYKNNFHLSEIRDEILKEINS